MIIIGSGMAGLASAAALAPHFEEVVLVERDRLQKVSQYNQCLFLPSSSRRTNILMPPILLHPLLRSSRPTLQTLV